MFDCVKINKGIRSKKFLLDGQKHAIVYNTTSQSVVRFEGDSAEVWQRIFSFNGKLDSSFEYIVKNGQFSGDPQKEALKVLDSFLIELESVGLIKYKNSVVLNRNEIAKTNSSVNPNNSEEQKISQQMADNHVLYSMALELTYRCNEKCVHCYCPEENTLVELSLIQIANLLDQFEELGGFMVQLTGGEPLIRKDILEILELFEKRNLVLNITSNLTLMNDKILSAIERIMPRSVGCSIYSAKPELHDEITGIRGSFSKSLESIKKLKQSGIPVVIKTPLMTKTVQYWKGIERLAKEIGCEYQLDFNISGANDGRLDPIDYRVKDRKILQEIFSSSFFNIVMNNEPISEMLKKQDEPGLCGAGANGLTISPDGSIRPCLGMIDSIGHFPSDSLNIIWKKSSFFKEWSQRRLKNIKECSECEKTMYCLRCPGAWKIETGDYSVPSPYTCFLAECLMSSKIHKPIRRFT